jgi:hypothetical protein
LTAYDLSELLGILGKHLVGLFLRARHVKQPGMPPVSLQSTFAGIIIHTRGVHLYLTAGHLLRDLDVAVSSGAIKVEKARLVDIFGYDAQVEYSIAFDFTNTRRHYLVNDSKGLDIGLMVLSDFYVRQMEVNKVVPVEDNNWSQLDGKPYSSFYVLGFPEDLNSGVYKKGTLTYIRPAIQKLEPITLVPDRIAVGHPNRFFAGVPKASALNFKGMSGGPIFGFRDDQPNDYWLVAVQSGWYPQNGIIVGCPMPAIGWLTSEALRIIQERD